MTVYLQCLPVTYRFKSVHWYWPLCVSLDTPLKWSRWGEVSHQIIEVRPRQHVFCLNVCFMIKQQYRDHWFFVSSSFMELIHNSPARLKNETWASGNTTDPNVLKLTWLCVTKYYMAWSISSFQRSLYPSTRGNLFKLAKLPIVSERDKNFLLIVLVIYGISYLTILLWLDLLLVLNGSLKNLTFLNFYC